MRVLRSFVVATAFGVALSIAGSASANGGAYLEFRGGTGGGTYFIPGDLASGTLALAIPRARRDILDTGPFYIYLGRDAVAEGRPLPVGLIRVGTAQVVHRSGDMYVLRTAFRVPAVSPGSYTISVCNSPCTISGFREPVTGYVEVVATAREAELLTRRDALSARISGLRRELRKSERAGEETQASLAQAQQDNARLADEVNALNARIGELEAGAASAARRTIDVWTAVAVAVAMLIAGAAGGILLGRRRTRIVVPDTVEGLERDAVGR
jgi:hypothetical protein